MAHFEENNSNTRGASVDLNLVPFIDLMSVCIIFLLITAVWTQVSMIQLGTSIYAEKTDESVIPTPPQADIQLSVRVSSRGYKIKLGSEESFIPIVKEGVYNYKVFLRAIQEIKKVYPEKIDVIVSVQNSMLYKDLVIAMDLLLKAGFKGLSISAGEI